MKRSGYSGACLCGAVAFRIEGALGSIVNCYCSMCRRWHGSAFRTRATLATEQFSWTRGAQEVSTYRSSPRIRRTFCSVCGSNLVNYYDEMPEVMTVSIGALDPPPDRGPDAHVFVGSKAPWVEIRDDKPQYDTFPPNPRELYRTRAG